MKSKAILTVLAVFVALFSCSMIGYILGANATDKANPAENAAQISEQGTPAKADIAVQNNNIVQKAEKTPSSSLTKKYILRESDGKVALFIKSSDGTEMLHSSYDVPIMFLPESDRDLLKKGIEFDSLDEIIKFAEDYVV